MTLPDQRGAIHPAERMPDGSARSGLSQNTVGQIVRERGEAIAERDRYRDALDTIHEEALQAEHYGRPVDTGWLMEVASRVALDDERR